MTGGMNIDGVSPINPVSRGKDTILLQWSGMSFEEKPKSFLWYFIAVLVAVGIIAYSVWQQDWFVIIITPIIAGVVFWYAKSARPIKINYSITPLGMTVDDKNYPFNEIHSYWVVYNDRVKKLYIAFTKKYLPALTVNIEEVDPITLRMVLSKKVPEQERRGESLLDQLVRMIGF